MVFGRFARRAYVLLAAALIVKVLVSTDTAVAQDVPGTVIATESVPAWLTPRNLPKLAGDQTKHAQDGIAYLLTDWQVLGNTDGYDSYYRFASKAIDRSGLEGVGQISITYDPRIETIALNFVHIIRDGKVIDRTADVNFSVVERESDLNVGIISGSLQAISNLKDIRVGDVVDFATTRHVRTTLWPGELFQSFTDRFSEPLGLRTMRILWPGSKPLTFKAINSDIAFRQKVVGNMVEWEWTGTDRPFAPGENEVPGWYPQYGRVDISTMKTWGQVAGWAAGLYRGDESMTPEFEAFLTGVSRRWPKPEDRITEVSRYLQDNIRYVGEELGEGSYVPRRPRTVLERGYGDCKDKSLLLAVALRRLGIDAVPALVSTTPGFDLPERLPSPMMFDHVIVRVVLNGRLLWIDPTATHRGGRGDRITGSDLGYALPIRASQDALEKIEGYGTVAGSVTVNEQFAIDENAPAALTLLVETRYSDANADWMRARVASSGTAKVARENLEFYQKRFPGLSESVPLVIQDDRDANRLAMIESYSLTKAEFEKGKILAEFGSNAYLVSDLLPTRQPGARRQPLALPAYTDRSQTIEVRVAGRAPSQREDIDMKAGQVALSRRSTRERETLRMVYSLRIGEQREAPANGAEAIYAISDKISEEAGLTLFLDKWTKQSANGEDSIDAEMLAPYRPELEKATLLMMKQDQQSFVEALSILNPLAEKVQRPSAVAGLIDGLKGLLLAALNRPIPAKAALLSSVEQGPNNRDMTATLLGLQINDRDPVVVLKTLNLVLRKQPDFIRTIDLEWVRMITAQIRQLPEADRETNSDEFCIILAMGGWRLEPRTVEGNDILGCAIKGLLKRKQVPQARALLAKRPTAQTLVELAIDRRYSAIWDDLEPMVKSGFRESIEDEVKSAVDASRQMPDDFGIATRHIRALRVAGRGEEAVAAGKQLAAKKDLIEASGENAFWFVNEYAYAFEDAGQLDAAIGQMDGLLALGVNSYPALVSQVINRAEMLNHGGRNELALAAFSNAETSGAQHASLYGKMWIWAGKACALRELSRPEEAAQLDQKLSEKPMENASAVTMAAACRGDQGAVEDMLIRRLADPEKREDALSMFVRFSAPARQSAFDSKLRRVVDAALASPRVQAKFAEYGRSVSFAGQRTYWGDY